MVGHTHRSNRRTVQLIRENFGALFDHVSITCLDVGARAGVTLDVLPVAPACVVVGLEPDRDECQRLNAESERDTVPWRELRYIPVALGSEEEGSRTLNIYSKRGCTSLLEANIDMAKAFAREHFFYLDKQVLLQTMSLDRAAKEYGFEAADYMKIDIQGAELEAFESGPELLSGELLALRTEVSFRPVYDGQPLYGDIERHLAGNDLWLAFFPEFHHWRRETQIKPHRMANGEFPCSRGELVHADAVFFRDPQSIDASSEHGRQKLLKLALLALCYDLIDLAAVVFRRDEIRQYADGILGADPIGILSEHSSALGRIRRRNRFSSKARWN